MAVLLASSVPKCLEYANKNYDKYVYCMFEFVTER